MNQQETFNEQESLQLITEMINKTKQTFHETGFGPIMWGSVVSFCALVSFISFQYDIMLPFDIWILIFVAIVPQVIYSVRESKRRRSITYNEVALDYTWITFGISMFILSIILTTLGKDYGAIVPKIESLRGNFRLSNHFTGIYLLIYGIPTFITGGIMKFKPMLIGGILCWVLSVISCFTDYKVDMLFTAIAAIGAWLIPGLILNKKYNNYKKANV